MPRTESGIVPDMIMNPHAIPSRMTIAQNLEQLLGKTAAVSGAIGDGTSFMNDGSPQEVIGHILENLGFEKYGNEVMYNGATGEQIPAAIFVGPVYGMRLKHMVEDKWQARGQGRKEVRTHQPTGGRGAQGGLKIGEMDRDAIIAHAGMAFVKESFMERSDGTTISICVSCGTVPIYNPRLNLAVCPMCDGPVRYTGNTIHNMELLPPVGRPKSKIVQVEMPYSTKLLTHEQETYLNLSMRYITTSGFQKLNPLEHSGTATEIIRELPRLLLPEVVVPAYTEEIEKATLTVEQLRSMGAQVNQLTKEEQAAQDVIQEDDRGIMIDPMLEMQQAQQMEQMQQAQQMQPMQSMVQMSPASFPQNEIIQGPSMGPSMGGMLAPGGEETIVFGQHAGFIPAIGLSRQGGDGVIAGGAMPGMGGMIVVDTTPQRMMQDGIDPGMGGRRPRRNPYQGGFGGGSGGFGGEPMPPQMPSSGGAIHVTKME